MNKYNESRRIARLNWARTEHGKKWSQDYMKKYRKRPEVKAKYREYYIKNKAHWGEITKSKAESKLHHALDCNYCGSLPKPDEWADEHNCIDCGPRMY